MNRHGISRKRENADDWYVADGERKALRSGSSEVERWTAWSVDEIFKIFLGYSYYLNVLFLGWDSENSRE